MSGPPPSGSLVEQVADEFTTVVRLWIRVAGPYRGRPLPPVRWLSANDQPDVGRIRRDIDRRIIEAGLADGGRRVISRLVQVRPQEYRTVLGSLETTELRDFQVLLRRLIAVIAAAEVPVRPAWNGGGRA